jgi:hypothetical protein
MNFRKRVLFVGQAYYNTWYLARALRNFGWKADVLNFDPNPSSQLYYHGEDFRFTGGRRQFPKQFAFFAKAALDYDIFHFSNANGIHFGNVIHSAVKRLMPEYEEIRWLRRLGKKIVYSNNGCLDGVSQTAFSGWGPFPVCSICPWRDRPDVCSDQRNLAWGRIRNELADYQCTIGGNRADYNDDPRVHEVPEFYCMDSDIWNPNIEIPDQFRLPFSKDTIKIFHAVGNYEDRTAANKVNIKGTHLYVPVIERLKREGHPVELMFFSKVSNRDIRYYQAQADLILDNLFYGFFGATGREGMMLGKTVACFLRNEWLEGMKTEIPEYVRDLPVVNISYESLYEDIKSLVLNPEKLRETGRRSREFAMKWHSAEAGARRLDKIYSDLLGIH